uniref:unspecific monooxygenase n=1 Tax=Adoxophyes honmai TaxID=85585 RepID=A0A455R6T0_ADOHO|nr:cytochrome P450 monooxygenase [Adoxophyes honmai]
MSVCGLVYLSPLAAPTSTNDEFSDNITFTMFLYIWLLALAAVLVLYLRRVYSRFEAAGVKHLPPLPLLGNMASIVFRKEHFVYAVDKEYSAFPEERFIGHYQFLKPDLIIRDVDLLKNITIKDFEHFIDHREFVNEEMDPIFGANMFSMKGQTWKDMRSTMSPAFTSSKLKHMIPFMVEVGDQMISSLKKKIEDSGNQILDIDSKDLVTRYANDVIASVAFGLKVDSQSDPDNEFFRMGNETVATTFGQLFKFVGFSAFPAVMKKLKVTLFAEAGANFFRNIVLSTMRDREERKILRRDMIHLLMEARKGTLSHDEKSGNDEGAGFATVEESVIGKKTTTRVWTDNQIIAQAVTFFTAGFDTVSTAMSFLLYELAVNPEVQDKLAREVKEHAEANGGQYDYTAILQLPYLDMVVSELLRKWPPAGGTDRLCMKDYNVGRPNAHSEKDFILKKGESIFVPIYSFHHDPRYFPNPSKFDPERFSAENKHAIKPFTYMPFGLGPRNCIGSRFALCEVKVMVYQLLQHIELVPCEKTQIPAELATDSFGFKIKGGHWLGMKSRS